MGRAHGRGRAAARGLPRRRQLPQAGDARGSRGRPDYTFLLPNGLVMHMDVKFPLDNYVRYLEARTDLERDAFRDQFLRDVRDRVQGAHDARLPRRGRRDRRLPAAVHPERAGVRVRAGARPRDPRRRAARTRSCCARRSRCTRCSRSSARRSTTSGSSARRTRSSVCSASSRCSGRSTSAQLDKVQQRFDGGRARSTRR